MIPMTTGQVIEQKETEVREVGKTRADGKTVGPVM
jgi:hypothetical protein